MSARKKLVSLLAALALLAGATEAALAITISITTTAPTTQVLAFNAVPVTTFTQTFQWIDDTATGHVELGQSFFVTGQNNWTVNGVILRVTQFGTAVETQPYTLRIWTVANATATAGNTMLASQSDFFPVGLTAGYWLLTINPVVLPPGQFFAFTIGFDQGPSPQRFVDIVNAQTSANPYANGQILYRTSTPLNFTATTDPLAKDLDFSILGSASASSGSGGGGGGGGVIPGPINPINPFVSTGFFPGVVGGVLINPSGVLENAVRDERGALGKLRWQAPEKIPIDLSEMVEFRKVSLRGLEAAIAESAASGQQLPEAVRCLAGLQRIRYVFVYPEQQDVVLAGPAEGWTVDGRGNFVGATTGRPVMLLDDLLVALRTARQAAQGGISCSIDPSSEGLNRLRTHVSTLKTIGDPQATAAEIEKVLGPQRISVSGVPPASHFARVLVAADYRMKRIAMGFEPSPVRGLISFLQMMPASGRGMSNMLPRWWLQPKYAPLLHDADRLAWEIRQASVQALTEEDFLTAAGNKEHTGKAHPAAQKWADLMTEKYDELAVAEPIFGQLQNCMDLAIVAALIVKEQLAEKAGYGMPLLMDAGGVRTAEFPAPKSVDSKASLLHKGRNWLISASGGVLLNSWQVADKTQPSDAPTQARAKAAPAKKTTWWWN